MPKRRAPKTGYDFDEKHEYRKHIWRSFKRWSPVRPCNAQVLLMPSSEGIEIDVAKSFGFLEENMHCVDDNPAIVATLKRHYPQIHTYGVDVVRACERIRQSGVQLACANFDFTGCVSKPLLMKMHLIGTVGVMVEGGLVAINVLRGRERPTISGNLEFLEACDRAIGLTQLLSDRTWADTDITPRDVSRIAEMFERLAVRDGVGMRDVWEPKVAGVYRSTAGNQTMLWVISEIRSINSVLNSRDRLVFKLDREDGAGNMYKERVAIAPSHARGGRFEIRKSGRDKKLIRLERMGQRGVVRTVAILLRQWLTNSESLSFEDVRKCWTAISHCPDTAQYRMLKQSGLWEYGEELFSDATTAAH